MTKQQEALSLYKTMCSALDKMGWRYEKEEDEFVVRTSAVGKDIAMPLFIKVDAERQVMYIKSAMPFRIQVDVRETITKAVVLANLTMLNGSFEFDAGDGYLAFKVVTPYMGSILSEQVCHYMIDITCSMTDKFNDKFKALVDGTMTLYEFNRFCIFDK